MMPRQGSFSSLGTVNIASETSACIAGKSSASDGRGNPLIFWGIWEQRVASIGPMYSRERIGPHYAERRYFFPDRLSAIHLEAS